MAIPKKYLGAFKAGHRVDTRQFIDDEFAHELLKRIQKNPNDEEAIKALEFMTKFNDEFHKNIIKKNDPKALHNTDALRQSLYARENAKNRDTMTARSYSVFADTTEKSHITQSYDVAEGDTGFKQHGNSGTDLGAQDYEDPNNYENDLINMIDHREEWETFLEHAVKLEDKEILKLVKQRLAKDEDKE